MEYYAATEKNEILPFATRGLEPEGIMLSEIGQSERDKYHMASLTWNLRYKTDEHKGSKNNIKTGRGQNIRDSSIYRTN